MQSKMTSDDKYRYKYSRGKALIFTIRSFNEGSLNKCLPDRRFYDTDWLLMKEQLDALGFETKSYYGQNGKYEVSKQTIMKKLKKAADDQEANKDIDCFVCVFMSYGFNGLVYASDAWFPYEELMDPFKGDKCPSLRGKPKVFILQTCMQPIETRADGPQPKGAPVTIPAEADFFTFWSHIPSHGDNKCPYHELDPRSKKNPDWKQVPNGSVFIRILASTLETMIEDDKKRKKAGEVKAKEDFLHLCVRVTGQVKRYLEEYHKEKFENNKQLLPLTIHVLTKELYLL